MNIIIPGVVIRFVLSVVIGAVGGMILTMVMVGRDAGDKEPVGVFAVWMVTGLIAWLALGNTALGQ